VASTHITRSQTCHQATDSHDARRAGTPHSARARAVVPTHAFFFVSSTATSPAYVRTTRGAACVGSAQNARNATKSAAVNATDLRERVRERVHEISVGVHKNKQIEWHKPTRRTEIIDTCKRDMASHQHSARLCGGTSDRNDTNQTR
jgi:hypothetical protein